MEPNELELEELSAPSGEPSVPEKPKRRTTKPKPKKVTFVVAKSFRHDGERYLTGQQHTVTEQVFEDILAAVAPLVQRNSRAYVVRT